MNQKMRKSFFIMGLAIWAMPVVAGGFTAKPLGILDATQGEREWHNAFLLSGFTFSDDDVIGGRSMRGTDVLGRQNLWIYANGQVSSFGFGQTFPQSSWDSIFEDFVGSRTIGGSQIVLGRAQKYVVINNSVFLGQRVYYWQNGQTHELTPPGEQYASSAGHRADGIHGVTQLGEIFGSSNVFEHDEQVGSDAWLYRNGSFEFFSTRNSQTPAPVPHPDGPTTVVIAGRTRSGLLHGNSYGPYYFAQAWSFDGNAYKTLGLTGQNYMDASGLKSSGVSLIDGDAVIGWSSRFDADAGGASTSWLYENGAYRTPIIPAGSPPNTSSTIVARLDRDCLLTSLSQNYDSIGIFLDTGTTAERVDPQQTRFVSADGYRNTYFHKVTSHGFVHAMSWIPVASENGGNVMVGSAHWLWKDGDLRIPELTDPLHMRSYLGTTVSTSAIIAVNHHGDAVGYSVTVGLDLNAPPPVYGFDSASGWFYDWQTDTTTPLVFDIADNGRRLTMMFGLTDNGLAAGAFEQYAGNDSRGFVPFIWSADFGIVPLETLVDGGLPRFTDYLQGSILDDGSILLSGTPIDSTNSISLLITIPEPGFLGLLAVSALLLSRKR